MQKEIEKGKPIILLAHVPFYTSQIETLKEASINTWGVPLIIGEGARRYYRGYKKIHENGIFR